MRSRARPVASSSLSISTDRLTSTSRATRSAPSRWSSSPAVKAGTRASNRDKQLPVVEAHGLRNIHIYETEEWINIKEAVGDLTTKFLCLNDVYPKGFMIPRRFIGENIIHLPTVKTHVFTTMTGAMTTASHRISTRPA